MLSSTRSRNSRTWDSVTSNLSLTSLRFYRNMLSSFSSTFSDLKVSSVRVIIDRDGDLISSVDMVDVVDAVIHIKDIHVDNMAW